MEDIKITYSELFNYVIYANVLLGVLFGSLPLIVGLMLGNRKNAFLGFTLTVIGGFLLGIFLSYPVSALFLWLIVRAHKATASEALVPVGSGSETTDL
jgi:hypothetical protein